MDFSDHPQRMEQRMVKMAMDAPLLEKDREFDLARRWREKRDQRALDELITAYLRLVISMASRYRHYGLPVNDLVQEGCIGLMQAAERFEVERDIRFSTYASWWIRSSMQDFILRNWSIVRTGTTAAQKKLFFNLRRLRSMIAQETQDDATAPLSHEARTNIARNLGVKPEEVDYMEGRLAAGDRSTNAPIGEEGEGEWQDIMPDARPLPEDAVMHDRDSRTREAWLAEALETLSDREKLIIRQRRLEDKAVTLAALGERLGISKERVRQIEHQALGKLRKSLVKIVGDPHRSGLIPQQS